MPNTSITEIASSYVQPEIWDANLMPTPDLDKAVRIYSTIKRSGQGSSIVLEHLIARKLTNVTDTFRTNKKSPFYRAHSAFINGHGNCIAHTEAITATGNAKNLNMYVSWDGKHATSIFAGRVALWDVDGFTGEANRWVGNKYIEDKDEDEMINTFYRAGREIISLANGRAFYYEHEDGQVFWEPIVGNLGENTSSFKNPAIFLPAEEGLRFLFSYVDLYRYEKNNPELAEELRHQIDQYLPKTRTTYP